CYQAGYPPLCWIGFLGLSVGGMVIARLYPAYKGLVYAVSICVLINLLLSIDPVYHAVFDPFLDEMRRFLLFGATLSVISYLFHFDGPEKKKNLDSVFWLRASVILLLVFFIFAYLMDQDISYTNSN